MTDHSTIPVAADTAHQQAHALQALRANVRTIDCDVLDHATQTLAAASPRPPSAPVATEPVLVDFTGGPLHDGQRHVPRTSGALPSAVVALDADDRPNLYVLAYDEDEQPFYDYAGEPTADEVTRSARPVTVSSTELVPDTEAKPPRFSTHPHSRERFRHTRCGATVRVLPGDPCPRVLVDLYDEDGIAFADDDEVRDLADTLRAALELPALDAPSRPPKVGDPVKTAAELDALPVNAVLGGQLGDGHLGDRLLVAWRGPAGDWHASDENAPADVRNYLVGLLLESSVELAVISLPREGGRS